MVHVGSVCDLISMCGVEQVLKRGTEALQWIKQTLTAANESLGLNKWQFHLQIKALWCPPLKVGS